VRQHRRPVPVEGLALQTESLTAADDGRADFDFLHGSWAITARRLTRPLSGSNEWVEFAARKRVRPMLGRLGNVDEFEAILPNGRQLDALTLRVFDPATRLWSIYWVDNQVCRLQPPTIGHFANGRGEFFGDDTYRGGPVRVAIRWTEITPTSARVEQAFSVGSGEDWEPNLRMVLTRVA
jgi:hypothetical protein